MNLFKAFFVLTALGCLFYGIDDLFIDAIYWLRILKRKITRGLVKPFTVDQLELPPEKRVAIMIPCWQEKDVVGHSLTNTINTIRYKKYDLFVGVYSNDTGTKLEVERLEREIPHVKMAICPNPGPTNKADNLNSIFQKIMKTEREQNITYDIFVIHDAEDVVHPLSLKLYNFLIPRKDMIQIPVFPLEVPLKHMTHWTYADEFAENHTKDMLVREVLGGHVPSAGVGTAFSRNAINQIEKLNNSPGKLFNIKTLTEDYGFSLIINRLKLKAIFVQQSVKRVKNNAKSTREWIATRALFPMNYGFATRQKSRWILGISFQEWKESGWEGNTATRYTLFRDRKGPFGHLITLFAYLFFITLGATSFGSMFFVESSFFTFFIFQNNWVTALLVLNLVFLAQRFFQRFIAVNKIYGFAPALLSLPRMIYGNIINVHAFIRAALTFGESVKSGQKPVWAKTSNMFPTPQQLKHYKLRLGDLLLDSSIITPKQMSHALSTQIKTKEKLGSGIKNHLSIIDPAAPPFLLHRGPVFGVDRRGGAHDGGDGAPSYRYPPFEPGMV